MAKYYLTYYEEYPIYEPAEGGYYYAGNAVSEWWECDNFYDAYVHINELCERYGLERSSDNSTNVMKKMLIEFDGSYPVAGDFTSRYIGDARTLRLETEQGFRSKERGWHPYE